MKIAQVPQVPPEAAADKALAEREKGESQALNMKRPNGHARRRWSKPHQVLVRQTDERNALLVRLQTRLGAGKGKPATITETIEAALDALEREFLRGTRPKE